MENKQITSSLYDFRTFQSQSRRFSFEVAQELSSSKDYRLEPLRHMILIRRIFQMKIYTIVLDFRSRESVRSKTRSP
jgi:hypothetical protein